MTFTTVDDIENDVQIISDEFKNPVYVISVNEVPKLYTETVEEAREEMHNIAKNMSSMYDGYNEYIYEVDPDTIHIFEQNRMYLISYESLTTVIKVNKVSHVLKTETTSVSE